MDSIEIRGFHVWNLRIQVDFIQNLHTWVLGLWSSKVFQTKYKSQFSTWYDSMSRRNLLAHLAVMPRSLCNHELSVIGIIVCGQSSCPQVWSQKLHIVQIYHRLWLIARVSPVKEETANPEAESVAIWNSFYHWVEWQNIACTQHTSCKTCKKILMFHTEFLNNYCTKMNLIYSRWPKFN